MEHIIGGIEEIRAPMVDIEAYSGLSAANMGDAIEFHLDGLKQEGLPIPEPSTKSVYVDDCITNRQAGDILLQDLTLPLIPTLVSSSDGVQE